MKYITYFLQHVIDTENFLSICTDTVTRIPAHTSSPSRWLRPWTCAVQDDCAAGLSLLRLYRPFHGVLKHFCSRLYSKLSCMIDWLKRHLNRFNRVLHGSHSWSTCHSVDSALQCCQSPASVGLQQAQWWGGDVITILSKQDWVAVIGEDRQTDRHAWTHQETVWVHSCRACILLCCLTAIIIIITSWYCRLRCVFYW